MSPDAATARSALLTVIAAIALAVAVHLGYALLILRLRKLPLSELLPQLRTGAPYIILGFFLTAVSAILGARLAAYRAGRDSRLTGLLVGVGVGLIVVVVATVQRRFNLWLPPNATLPTLGGWLGSRMAARKSESDRRPPTADRRNA